MIYSIFLVAHSLIRWLAVLAGLLVVARAVQGRLSGGPYSVLDRRLTATFVSALHLNFVIGLLLYVVLSPITTSSFGAVGAAMKISATRFFLVEHPFGILIAIALVTVGSAKVKRATDDAAKFQKAVRFFVLGYLVLFFSIPWPFYPAGRALLPF